MLTFTSFLVIILVVQAFCAVALNRKMHLKTPKSFLKKLEYFSFYHALNRL